MLGQVEPAGRVIAPGRGTEAEIPPTLRVSTDLFNSEQKGRRRQYLAKGVELRRETRTERLKGRLGRKVSAAPPPMTYSAKTLDQAQMCGAKLVP